MARIDLPSSGQGALQVWPIGGPKLFGGEVPPAGSPVVRKASASAIMVVIPPGQDGVLWIYSGADAGEVDTETVIDRGVPMFPGTYNPWGVPSGLFALAAEGGAINAYVYGARESRT